MILCIVRSFPNVQSGIGIYPDHCNPPKDVYEWKCETALFKTLDLFYGETSRFSESVVEPDLMKYKMDFLKVELHIFYSFSDIVAFFGRVMGKYIADRLITSKKLQFKDFWLNLPLVIHDGYTHKDLQVKICVVDWFGIEYSSLKETCRSYAISMENKDLMDEFKTCMDVPYRDNQHRDNFIKYAESDLLLSQLSKKY